MNFDKTYYESNNYTNYLERKDRYVRLINEILEFLDKLNLAPEKHELILDFGCAVGFALEAFPRKGYFNLYGVDVSDWAINIASEKNLYVAKAPMYRMQHTLTLALNVLEHMSVEQLKEFMTKIQSKIIIFRMPICERSNEDYVLEVSRTDPTHIIRWTKNQWKSFISSYGYVCLDLNLHTIYDSKGVYAGIAIHRSI